MPLSALACWRADCAAAFSVGSGGRLVHISAVPQFTSSRCAAVLDRLLLVLAVLLAAPAPADTNAPTAQAWTNLVAGSAWGTNPPAASSAATNLPPAAPDDAVRAELRQLLADDDAAQAGADRLMQDTSRRRAAGEEIPDEQLQMRLRARFIAVRGAYQQFLTRHPRNVEAMLAYGSLLNDLGEEDSAVEQWLKARALAPENPSVWNNLANHYAANQDELKAFSFYEKAISLATNSAPYQRNLGSAIINLRSNAMTYYSLSEPAVLEKGFQLLRAAERSLPDDFALATELAQTLYALRPLRTNELLAAWRRALDLAGDEIESEGVRLHLARVNLLTGKTAEARQWLDAVTNTAFAALRQQLEAQLAKHAAAGATNPPATKP